MGKATRWLRNLLGMKKDKESPVTAPPSSTFVREKKRWSFSLGRDSTSSATELHQQQQNRHAIAVAADAASAAAAAADDGAVEVVRRARHGKGVMVSGGKWNGNLAAVKIQNVFRGYLARKALRALKGLVKLQALVRGFLVRKRAALTLYRIKALIRAQTALRFQRSHRRISRKEHRSRVRRTMERFDEIIRNEIHNNRLSASAIETLYTLFEENAMVNIEGYLRPRSRSRSRRIQSPTYDFGRMEDPYYSPESKMLVDLEWLYSGGEESSRGARTTHSTPRLSSSWITANGPPTPARSVSGEGESFYRSFSNCPNYMASTESFCAKVRSQSAPRQRPDQIIAAARKRIVTLHAMMASSSSRNSFSGVRMSRSSTDSNS